MSTSQNLGFGVSVPITTSSRPLGCTFWAKSYSSQGLLLQGEYRQRFANGRIEVQAAAIKQLNRSGFDPGTADALATNRAMIASKGGVQDQSALGLRLGRAGADDNNFVRTYQLLGTDELVHTNQAYLTGLGSRNSFDMRAFYFDVQDADPKNKAEHRQAIVHPVIDYRYFHPTPAGRRRTERHGQFHHADPHLDRPRPPARRHGRGRPLGGPGRHVERLSAEVEWKRTFIVPGGLSLTPILVARGDGVSLQNNDPSGPYRGDFYRGDTASRAMLTAGIEARYPVLVTTDNSSHIFEPIVQVFARPDEAAGRARCPTRTRSASSLTPPRCSSATSSRASTGWKAARAPMSACATPARSMPASRCARSFGQSFQLAGRNSLPRRIWSMPGANSGLETAHSDYVGMIGRISPTACRWPGASGSTTRRGHHAHRCHDRLHQ